MPITLCAMVLAVLSWRLAKGIGTVEESPVHEAGTVVNAVGDSRAAQADVQLR
ncbi:hypothetical protein ACFVW2_39515 [Streptomyces sp. NPDC058171]